MQVVFYSFYCLCSPEGCVYAHHFGDFSVSMLNAVIDLIEIMKDL